MSVHNRPSPASAMAALALALSSASFASGFVTPSHSSSLTIPGANPLRSAISSTRLRNSRHLQMAINGDTPDPSSASPDAKLFDEYISVEDAAKQPDLRAATRTLKNHPDMSLPRDRFQRIFDAIEVRTSEAEENDVSNRATLDMSQAQQYPPVSPSRNEMTELYDALADAGHLQLFGAAGRKDRPLPAMGSKVVTPTLLEQITEMEMLALTPKPTNTFLIGGIILAVAEGFLSLSTGIDLNFLVLCTITLAFLDKLLVNGAVSETAMRTVMPEYRKKILRHEAGHFLCAYLLGCPVEGCVLSSWAALQDSRFGGRATTVSAGTSFFDRDLSEEMNGQRPLSRSSIDRYSVIVMGGIAAEAINFGRADGGAGDEMALVRFLSSINPRGGGAVAWDSERIKSQARWGALQAVLLLRTYKASYDALVDALERGGNLGECIYAIEKAATDSGEKPLEKPLGYIAEKGLYGEWSDVPPSAATNQYAKPAATVTAPVTEVTTTGAAVDDKEDVSTSLSELRKAAEQRLKEINEELEALEKSKRS